MKKDSLLAIVYSVLLIIGIWHAFPSLKVIGDEAPYVGGVLRAMEEKTIIPEIDYSYTISFYANYLLMVPFIVVLFLIFGGSLPLVTSFLMENVYLAYLIPRLISVFSAIILLILFLKFLEKKGRSFVERLILTSIVFGNITFFVLAHTGKMWMLSLLLWFLAFYYFDKALTTNESKAFFWSPVFAFLAFANFPVNVIALIFVAWLWWDVWKFKLPPKPLLLGTVIGLLAFGVFFAFNHNGWSIQNSVTPVEARSFLGVLKYLLFGFIALIPLHLAYAFLCTKVGQVSKPLMALGLSLLAYMVVLFWRAPWVGGDHPEAYFRYFVYIGFILGLMFSYVPMRRERIAKALAIIALVFVVRIDYLLAIPTTYNETRNYLINNARDRLIVSDYTYLDLPKNRESYLILDDSLCQSRCQYGRVSGKDSGLFVIDAETKQSEFERIKAKYVNHFLVSAKLDGYISIDNNLGPYSTRLFAVDRLGPEFFIKDLSVAPREDVD